MHVHPKRLPKLSTTKVGTRLSPQHGCPMSPAFAHRTKTIQPALLTAQMNDMPLDLSQSDLQARRGRTRTHIQSHAPWFGLCVHTTRIHPLQCHTSLCSRPIMHICMHMHMHMHMHTTCTHAHAHAHAHAHSLVNMLANVCARCPCCIALVRTLSVHSLLPPSPSTLSAHRL